MNDREENFEALLSMNPQIHDDGFTEALMLRLPPRRNLSRIRTAILLAFSLAACGIVAAVPGARHLLAELVSGFARSSLVEGFNLVTAAVLAGLLLWGAVAAATSDA
jgi:hypothetical protein